MPADQDASKGYDPTAEEYYHGYGCTIVSTGQKIPIAAEFTESKQAPEETAMRVTCDALAAEKPIWMLGDSAYDTLGWHDHLLAAGVVPVAPYNARNTDDPKDIEYRVEARIDEHSEDVQLKQSTLDETYNRRSGVERTNDAVRTAASGTFAPEAASTHEHKCSSRCAFVSLLRSPTTNAETIQEAPSSRYENYSMTPSTATSNTRRRLHNVRRAFTITDEQQDYSQYDLNANPFPYSPVPAEDPEIYCGQQHVSDKISSTVSSMLSTGKSKHLVVTGKYGNGKSHTLKYTRSLLRGRDDVVVGYVAQPGEGFLDIYHEFVYDLVSTDSKSSRTSFLHLWREMSPTQTRSVPVGWNR